MAILQASEQKQNWFDNTEGFRKRLNYGFTGEMFVVAKFVESGLFIPVWEMGEFRKNSTENTVKKVNANQKDLILYRKSDGCRFHLEIKTRNLEFQSERNYPFKTVAIDTTEGWQLKTEKPHAVIIVSNPLENYRPKYYYPCGAIAVIVTKKLQEQWTVERLYDRDINLKINTLVAPVEQFRTLQTLIKFLNEAR